MKIDTILFSVSVASVLCVSLYIGIFYTAKTPVHEKISTATPIDEKEITRLHEVPIILYHNIDGDGPYSMPLERLERQFLLLREHSINVISLQTLERHFDDRNPFLQKAVSITFDDGYVSMYTLLLPLAKAMNYPITLFVYTDAVFTRGTQNITWAMLKEMEKGGIDIQCHSESHADLVEIYNKGTIESKYRLYREMYLSKRIIELYLHKTIDYFAFPYGRYNVALADLCRDAGYKRVFSTDFGPNIVIRNNYCLRRHHIKSNYTDERVLGLVQ